jgi:hypothetical protein
MEAAAFALQSKIDLLAERAGDCDGMNRGARLCFSIHESARAQRLASKLKMNRYIFL